MLEMRNFIGGEWTHGETTLANINPSDTSDIIGDFAQGSISQLNDAVQAARAAQPKWWTLGIQKRHDVLMAIGTEMMARAEEIGRLLSREEGKPLVEGKGEVYRAGQFFTYSAAEALRQMGEYAQSVRPGIEIDVRREPVGVVAIISPWNFPVATPAWKIAPALAYGNAVVWKPANLTPASALVMAQIIAKQDIPAGLFNVILGAGQTIGQHLASHKNIDAISFTGSVPVGRKIAGYAIQNMTKIQMEMGSKNPMIIMDDADLDSAITHSVNAAFGGTGQKCTAASRLIIHETIHDEFVEKLVSTVKALKVGHALDQKTQIGPVVSPEQLEQNLTYIKIGQAEHAELLCGGTTLELPTKGHFMAPAVFSSTKNNMRINQEEMFAPITSIIKVSAYEEALSCANDSEFGLTAAIMTKSLARANHFKSHMRAGCVMVNLPTAGTDYHVPFGGRGASSYGPREQGHLAQEFYTTVKTAYIGCGSPE